MRHIALILGSAETLQDDLRMVRELLGRETLLACTIIACNDAGVIWPHRLDHWVTAHAEEMPARKAKREFQVKIRARDGEDAYVTWTRQYPFGMKEREELCDRTLGRWQHWDEGSTGLMAVGVADELGLSRRILCGVPMDVRPHFNRVAAWPSAPSHQPSWLRLADELRLTTRSCSGWTRDLLGAPTKEWIAEVSEPLTATVGETAP